MNASRCLATLALGLCCIRLFAAEDEFYLRFREAAGTNHRNIRITSPHLVDTNNAAPKVQALSLVGLKADPQLSGVSLGMTMKQVVAHWGKPRSIWSNCQGGPTFFYTGITVIFEPDADAVTSFYAYVSAIPPLGDGLSSSSSIDEFKAVLGKPTKTEQDSSFFLVYDTPHSVLRVGFNGRNLYSVQLTRAKGDAQ